jgi:ADP-ribose diphosphatase
MNEKPKILHQSIVAKSHLFTVEAVDYKFSNGVERKYERLISLGSGAVMMVAMLDDEHVALIREFAGGLEEYTLTLPKGAVDLGETFEHAANRELQEEIGYAANKITFLKRMSLSPSYIKGYIDIFLAQDLYPSVLEGDEPEPLELVKWPIANLHELVMRDDCTEGRAIAALYLARDHLAQISEK